MRAQLFTTILLLTPAFLILNSDFSWEDLSIRAIRRVGDKSSVRVKLNELGFTTEEAYENFRYRQIIITFLIVLVELLLLLFIEVDFLRIAILLLSTICGVIYLLERNLDLEVMRHREAIESEFPAIVEMMTLALSAGETPLASMQRISHRAEGALASEFKIVIEDVSLGAPFVNALDSMGRRVHSYSVRRFIDALVIAINRGAPIIEVLHSHAREARDHQRNRVLSAASKSEMSMMIPVVFLILPISILFALWPSISNLNLFAQG